MADGKDAPPGSSDRSRRSAEEIERDWYRNVYAGDDQPQLTLRAVAMGSLLGCVMAFSNLYVGLRAGWGLGVAITACIISFSLFRLFERVAPAPRPGGGRRWLGIFDRPRGRVSILENNCMQSTASSAGYSTGATLVSAFPAYVMITGHHLPFWTVATLVCALAALGVFLAIPMKRSMVNVEQLPFPSGIAAAETLRSLHGAGTEARAKARGLFTAMGLGVLVGWFRDGRPSIIPSYLPVSQAFARLGLPRLAQLTSPAGFTLTVEASTVFAAAGAIMGLRTAASMALGAVLDYGVIAPWMYAHGAIHELGFRGIVSWSVWSGVAVMTSAALLNFFWNWRTIGRALAGATRAFRVKGPTPGGDPLARIEVPGTWFAAGVGIASVVCVVVNHHVFRIPIHLGVVAVVVSGLMAIVACRATGETDTTPVGALGKITQLLYGGLMPQDIGANLMTANVTSSAASSSADLLTDLKSGYLLGANPRKQFLAQLFGIFGGTLAATWGFYVLVPDASALGGDRFPAPAAQVWRAVAELLARGTEALPPYALGSLVVGLVAGALLTVLEKLAPRWRRWIPSPVGVGMAFTFQGYTAMAFFLGGLAAWIYEKRRPEQAEVYTIPVASGLIAGESLTGVAVALLQAKGLL
jgi:putative OPT family oligopeptide transporter